MAQNQKPFAETGTSPPPVIVQSVEVTPGVSLAVGWAEDPQGRRMTFVGDWRPMLEIAGALRAGHAVEAYLHEWQIVAWKLDRRRS